MTPDDAAIAREVQRQSTNFSGAAVASLASKMRVQREAWGGASGGRAFTPADVQRLADTVCRGGADGAEQMWFGDQLIVEAPIPPDDVAPGLPCVAVFARVSSFDAPLLLLPLPPSGSPRLRLWWRPSTGPAAALVKSPCTLTSHPPPPGHSLHDAEPRGPTGSFFIDLAEDDLPDGGHRGTAFAIHVALNDSDRPVVPIPLFPAVRGGLGV